MKRTLKATLEYIGTDFHGWAKQPGLRTVQEEIEKAFSIVLGHTISVQSAGRTDARVHALGQVISFKTTSEIGLERLQYSANALLPGDVLVKELEEKASFNARWSAISRSYEYVIINRRYMSPFELNRAWHYRVPLNTATMAQALKYFEGTHDFTAFCTASRPLAHFVRTVHETDLTAIDGEIRIFIKANSFLHNMVRIMVGTLIEAGLGKLDPDSIPAILEAKDRGRAGFTAPAHGLYLVEVEYGEE